MNVLSLRHVNSGYAVLELNKVGPWVGGRDRRTRARNTLMWSLGHTHLVRVNLHRHPLGRGLHTRSLDGSIHQLMGIRRISGASTINIVLNRILQYTSLVTRHNFADSSNGSHLFNK